MPCVTRPPVRTRKVLVRVLAIGASLVTAPGARLSAEPPASSPTTAAAPAELKEEFEALLAQLDAPSFPARQKATESLIELGDPARPLIEAALNDTSRKLSVEQTERLKSILAEGATLLWEQRSGLGAAELDLLRSLQNARVEQQKSYEVSERIRAMIRRDETTDMGLALIVKALLSQMPKTQQEEQTGFQSHLVYDCMRQVLDKSSVGPATGEALAPWVRDFFLPAMKDIEKARRTPSFHYMEQTIRPLVTGDMLTQDGYESIVQAFCERQVGVLERTRNYYDFLSRPDPTIAMGLVFSRHATSDDIGRLLQGLMLRASIQSGSSYESFQAMDLLLASPALTDAHVRGFMAWAFAPMGGELPQNRGQIAEVLNKLAVRTRWTPDDFREAADVATSERGGDYIARWDALWKAHGQGAVLKADAQPECRYLSVELDVSDPDKPTASVVADRSLVPGLGYVAHGTGRSRERQFVRLRPQRDPWSNSSGNDERRMWLDIWQIYSGGGYSGGGQDFAPGEIRNVGSGSRSDGNTTYRYVRLATILALTDTADDPPADRLKDAEYWIDQLFDDALESERQNVSTTKPAPTPRPRRGGRSSFATLSACRTRHTEERLRKAVGEEPPRVAAAAAVLLADWGADVDTDRLMQLLDTDDLTAATQAASALAMKGKIDGALWLIKRLKDAKVSDDVRAKLLSLPALERLDADARAKLAAELIRTVLPTSETPEHPAVNDYLLVRVWTGLDFGYVIGGDPAANNAALAKYHEWAEHPTPPPTTDTADDDEAIEGVQRPVLR